MIYYKYYIFMASRTKALIEKVQRGGMVGLCTHGHSLNNRLKPLRIMLE